MQASCSLSRPLAWVIWVLTSLFYAYQYLLRVMPNIMLSDIMEQFDMNTAIFGQFSGVYYIGYSLMHLPVGIMLDRYGPKKVMTGCILLTVAGLLPHLFAHHWAYPMAGRLLLGVGASAAILGVFKIIRLTFSAEHFPRMLSLSVTIGLLGAIYGGGPLSYTVDTLGSQAAIQLLASAGIVLAAATYWAVPNVGASSSAPVMADIKEVLGNSRVVASCIFAGLMVGTLEGFADVWGTVFFKQIYGFDTTLAASMPSMIYVGMCFGAPVLSFMADKANSYLGTIIGAGATMLICFSLVLFSHLSPGTLSVSLAVVGVCCAYQILAIYKASTYVRVEVAGLTTAVANMIIMIFGYAFHTSIGGIVSIMQESHADAHLTYGLTVIPAALFLGICGFGWLLATEKAAARIQHDRPAHPSSTKHLQGEPI